MKRPPLFDRLSALADPIRVRALLVLERHELTVSELRAVLQLPQSNVLPLRSWSTVPTRSKPVSVLTA